MMTFLIPQCPYCKKSTIRKFIYSTTTAVYYPPTYNESGENINPDQNVTTAQYLCMECANKYTDVYCNNS